jgi:uncharacterized protein
VRVTLRFRALFVALCLLIACRDRAATPGDAASGRPAASSSAAPSASAAKTDASASAQPSASAVASAAASAAEEAAAIDARKVAPFLWRAKKGEKESWLLGTMHVGADAEKNLNPLVWTEFAKATTFAMECDTTSVSPFKISQLAVLPEGQTLDHKLSAKGYAKLQEIIGGGLKGAMLNRYRPWFAASLAEQTLAPPGTPMDLVFQEKATAAKKKMVYLETVEQQIDVLDRALSAEVLEDTLQDWPKAEKAMKEMIAAYLRGDVETTERLAFDPEDVKKHAKLYDLTITRRNLSWMPAIEKMCADGNAFIAVGAGHMLGEKGLLAMLEKKGYAIDRMTPGE